MEYMVVIEKGDDVYGAYVPDLPGCVAVGDSRKEVLSLIQEAIALHVEMLREDGVGHRFVHVGQFCKLPLDNLQNCPTLFGRNDDYPREDGLPIPVPHSMSEYVAVFA